MCDEIPIEAMEWTPNHARKTCACCARKFHVFRRRHHCRMCGNLICHTCLQRQMILGRKRKVCNECRARQMHSVIEQAPFSEPLLSPEVKEPPPPPIEPTFPARLPITALFTSIIFISQPSVILFITLFVFIGAVYFFSEKKKVSSISAPKFQINIASNSETIRAAKELKSCLALMKESLSCKREENGWVFHSEQKGVEILLKTAKIQNKQVLCVRGESIVDVSMDNLLKTINTHHREYDKDVKTIRDHQVFDSDQVLSILQPEGVDHVARCTCMYMSYNRIFPIAARDACVVQCSGSIGKDRVILVRSIERDDVPDVEDHIRVNLICHGFYFQPISDTQTRMQLVSMVDPMGDIPAFLVAKVAPDRALSLHRISSCAKRYS